MASQESKQIRATFGSSPQPSVSVAEERRVWEAAAAETNRTLGLVAQPVQCDRLYGELIGAEQTEREGRILFFHGGGYNSGSCVTHRALAAQISGAAGVPVLLIDYRLAPEHPFPAAVEDAALAYRWLLEQGWAPEQIVIGGDSAGAGLAIACLLKLRDTRAPLPAAAFVISPWLDLALQRQSLQTHTSLDPLVTVASLQTAADYYLGDHDPTDPYASPLYGSFQQLPPLLIHVGEHELLLGDAVRLSEQAQAAGVQAQLRIWQEMWHVWHAWAPALPEAQAAIAEIGAFVRQQLA